MLFFALSQSWFCSSGESSFRSRPASMAAASVFEKRLMNLSEAAFSASSGSILSFLAIFAAVKRISPTSSNTSPSPESAASSSRSSSLSLSAISPGFSQSKPAFAAFFETFSALQRAGSVLATEKIK